MDNFDRDNTDKYSKKKIQHTVKLTLISKHSADVEGLGSDEDFNPFDNNNPDPFDKSVKYNVQYGHTKKKITFTKNSSNLDEENNCDQDPFEK